jgi:hypothetical protein
MKVRIQVIAYNSEEDKLIKVAKVLYKEGWRDAAFMQLNDVHILEIMRDIEIECE